jgi:hypothetical protein
MPSALIEEFYIAGSANDPDFAEAELLADRLIKTHHNTSVIKDMRHPCEWEEFRKMIAQQRGFSLHLPAKSIVIWRRDGKLIGGVKEFSLMVKTAYDIVLDVDRDLIRRITEENVRVRGQKHGPLCVLDKLVRWLISVHTWLHHSYRKAV